MPDPSDHHRPQATSLNPFVEEPRRISVYTAQEIATIQNRLDKQLGPEYISTRPGAGGSKVHYLAADKVINLANQVFGFNGWSSQIMSTQIDFCDEATGTGKIDVGLAIVMRVTLRDGTYHEDVGYGHIENCKGKAAAFEKARKEAATDSLKRALRNFGNILGNCLYDKDYLGKVTKVKAQPSHKWDPEDLHRHASYRPKQEPNVKPEPNVKAEPNIRTDPTAEPQRVLPAPPPRLPQQRQQTSGPIETPISLEAEDEFGGDLFDELDMADSRAEDIALPESAARAPPANSRPVPPRLASAQKALQNAAPRPPQHTRPQAPAQGGHSTPPNPFHHTDTDPSKETPLNVAFVSGRAVAPNVDTVSPADVAHIPFNPNAESPSIRRTPGVNHSKSIPVSRAARSTFANVTPGSADAQSQDPGQAQGPAQAAGLSPHQLPKPLPNPAVSAARQIGAPMSPRRQSGFKAPAPVSVKRTAPLDGPMGRPALTDVTNAANGPSRSASPEKGVVGDESAKRARVSEE